METPATLLPTPTASSYGSNRSRSPRAAVRPSLSHLASHLLPTPASAESRPAADTTAHGSTPMRRHTGSTRRGTTRLLPTPRVSDARGPGRHGAGGPDLRTTISYLPTPRGSDGTKGSPAQRGSHGDPTLPAAAVATVADHTTAQPHPDRQHHPAVAWGPYADAVARWQHILGRPSPAPTQPGRHGRPVLAPRWVEWLMGLPDGWVTGLDLPRTVALRLLGNGVVPQASAALRALLFLHAQPGSRS